MTNPAKSALIIALAAIAAFSAPDLAAAGPSALTGQAQEGPYKDLLGAWDVQTEDGQYTFTFTFSVENNELKGVFTGQSGEAKMESLKFEAGKVAFFVKLDRGGQEMIINFSATVAGEALTGMLSLEFGEANIVGKKKK
jgi:hypothetical protein